jgi:glycosyltransferase involved in cell wall biosynthesis
MEKYTVIIPTRDRAETLEATIKTCLQQTYINFQIIVSDNCSKDNTKQIISNFKDSRIVYINPGRRLSMAANFEFALSHVTDGFVMFIGSDDGLMPGAITYVESIVKQYKVKAVSCNQASYVWPNFPDKSIAGNFIFFESKKIEIRNSKKWIKKTLAYPSLYCFQLPNLYCGFVHKEVIDKVYKNGIYFRSCTPDAYSAFATAIFIDNYAFSHKSFCIAGASAKSNGASSLHPVGNSNESRKYYIENEIPFFDGFVSCPSFEIICIETFAQLANSFPEKCMNYRINYNSMLYLAIKNTNKRTSKAVLSAVSAMQKNFSVKARFNVSLICSYFNLFFTRFYRIFLVLIHSLEIYKIKNSQNYKIDDVYLASLQSSFILNNSNYSFLVSNRYKFIKRIKFFLGFKL